MSEVVFHGTTGGFVFVIGSEKSSVIGVRPVVWSTEKQAIPAIIPPFATQAELTISTYFDDFCKFWMLTSL